MIPKYESILWIETLNGSDLWVVLVLWMARILLTVDHMRRKTDIGIAENL